MRNFVIKLVHSCIEYIWGNPLPIQSRTCFDSSTLSSWFLLGSATWLFAEDSCLKFIFKTDNTSSAKFCYWNWSNIQSWTWTSCWFPYACFHISPPLESWPVITLSLAGIALWHKITLNMWMALIIIFPSNKKWAKNCRWEKIPDYSRYTLGESF